MKKKKVSVILPMLLLMSMATLSFETSTVGSEPRSFAVIPPEDMTYTLRDHRTATMPETYDFWLHGEVWITEYPYSDTASLVTNVVGPYPESKAVYIYMYADDLFKTLLLPSPFLGGGFEYPGTVTSVCKDDQTYLFTGSKSLIGQGQQVSSYPGGNISWPFSAVIDYPDFTGMAPLNLVLPAAELGYPLGQSLWIDRSWCVDGYDIYASSAISSYIGGTPRGRYLYFIDLTNPAFSDVTTPHEVYPAKEIPWDAPIATGFYHKVTENVLLHVRYAAESENYVFYDLTTDLWQVFTAKSYHVIWHKQTEGHLSLLDLQREASDRYRYTFNRVDLTALDNLETLSSNPVETLWERTFHQDYAGYYPTHIVKDDQLYIFEGCASPQAFMLDSVSTLDLITGELVSEEKMDITFFHPRAALYNLQHPSAQVDILYYNFMVDLNRDLILAINATDVVEFIAQETGISLCEDCYYQFFLTRYDLSSINLLGFMHNDVEGFAYLTSIDIEFEPPFPRTIDGLKAIIEELGSKGHIDNQGVVKSLLAKLNVAQRLVDKGKTDEARSMLEDDFIPQVQNLAGIRITVEAADFVIESAEYIIAHL